MKSLFIEVLAILLSCLVIAAYEWVPWDYLRLEVPDDAVIGGKDTDGRDDLYVIRGSIRAHTVTGKYNSRKAIAYVPFDDTENEVKHFEILTGNNLEWGENIHLGRSKVSGSTETAGVYVCRARVDGNFVIGSTSWWTCLVTYKGKQYEFKNGFEYLQSF